MTASALARQHQLHGAQPVLPVLHVAAAADWFVRMLGFEVDFLLGEPPAYGRVKLGDRSWGDQIHIHLQGTAGDITPCGATRLHVGHDVDGLHAHLQRQGAEALTAPQDQPWGLREISLRAPGGHLLVLGAEVAAPAHDALPRAVITCHRAKPGQDAAMEDILRRHVPLLQGLGLATDRAPLLLRAADGSWLQVFEWCSPAAIGQAHTHPEVLAIWAEFDAAGTSHALSALPEVHKLFSDFASV
jgi:hypothetical protein